MGRIWIEVARRTFATMAGSGDEPALVQGAEQLDTIGPARLGALRVGRVQRDHLKQTHAPSLPSPPASGPHGVIHVFPAQPMLGATCFAGSDEKQI